MTGSAGLSRVELRGLFAIAAAGALLPLVPAAKAQHFVSQPSEVSALERNPPSTRPHGDEIIAKMIDHNRARSESLQSYSSLREYEIRDMNDRVVARAVVRVEYRSPGTKSFRRISEEGSWIVRHLVFDRLLQAEEEASSGQEHRESSISTENYSFNVVGEDNLGTRRCFIVEAQPRKRDSHLFEGRLWIDAQDFGIAKISGHPAAELSFWITGARFERQYQRIDGFWLPHHDETVVNVKAHGTKVFRIEHKQYVINDLAASAASLTPSD